MFVQVCELFGEYGNMNLLECDRAEVLEVPSATSLTPSFTRDLGSGSLVGACCPRRSTIASDRTVRCAPVLNTHVYDASSKQVSCIHI